MERTPTEQCRELFSSIKDVARLQNHTMLQMCIIEISDTFMKWCDDNSEFAWKTKMGNKEGRFYAGMETSNGEHFYLPYSMDLWDDFKVKEVPEIPKMDYDLLMKSYEK